MDSYIQLKSLKVNVKKFYSDISQKKNFDNKTNHIEIIAENLSYRVNDKNILNPVNFSIENGDRIKISGENGTGKTTLIKILSNIYTDYNGNISINNTELNNAKNININYFGQNSYVFPTTVKENIFLGKNKIDTVFTDNKLLMKTNMNGLSGGEKHKITLDRALIGNSNIFIFDEPLNHLDSESTEKFLKVFDEIEGIVIFVDHKNIIKNYNKEIILSH